MKKKLSEKQKVMAYVLNTDSELNANQRITQKKIGDLFGVSQPTVAQAMKDVRHRIEVSDLKKQLFEAKKELVKMKESGVLKEIEINDNSCLEYRQRP